METKGLLFGSIGTSTMIVVDVLKSDFATTKNEKKMVIAQPLTSGLTMRAVDRWGGAAFSSSFRGFGFFPFRQRVSPHPPATNAYR
jgi:hypothetical protein